MEFFITTNRMLQDFVYKIMRAHGRENLNFKSFSSGVVLVRDSMFLLKVY